MIKYNGIAPNPTTCQKRICYGTADSEPRKQMSSWTLPEFVRPVKRWVKLELWCWAGVVLAYGITWENNNNNNNRWNNKIKASTRRRCRQILYPRVNLYFWNKSDSFKINPRVFKSESNQTFIINKSTNQYKYIYIYIYIYL